MFSRQSRIRSFHVVVLQRTAKKCTKIYNARAQALHCSLNLLFSDVPVANVGSKTPSYLLLYCSGLRLTTQHIYAGTAIF